MIPFVKNQERYQLKWIAEILIQLPPARDTSKHSIVDACATLY